MTAAPFGLRWVVALPSEAVTVISHYGLQHICDLPFKVYATPNGQHGLVISGVGRTLGAAATVFLHQRVPGESSVAWINVGIGGSGNRELGDVVQAHKVVCRSTGRVWYPSPQTTTDVPSAIVTTVAQPELLLSDDTVFDMEAAGVCELACRWTTLELISVIKVISDNRTQSIEGITRSRIREWMSQALPAIDQIASTLFTLSQTQARTDLCVVPWIDKITSAHHFSVTQTHQLRRLLRRWWALSDTPPPLFDANDSRDYLTQLLTAIDNQPVAWGER